MVIQIASLVAKVGFQGKSALAGMQKFAGATRKTGRGIQNFSQKSKIQLDGLKKTWKFLGNFAKGAIGKMITATPLLQAQMAMMNFQFREVWRTLGEALAPIIEKIVEWVTKLVEWFKNLDPAIIKTIAVVLGLVGAFVTIMPLLSALPMLFSPIGLAIAGIIAVIALLTKAYQENFGGFRDFIDDFVANFKEKFGSLKEPIQKLIEAFKELWEKVKPIIEKLTALWVENMSGKFKQVIDDIVLWLQYFITQFQETIGFFSDIISGDFEGAMEHLKNIFRNMGQFVADIFRNVWDRVKAGFISLFEKIGEAVESAVNWLRDIFSDDEEKIGGPLGGEGTAIPITTPLGGPIGTTIPLSNPINTSVVNYIDVTVDASGTESDALDIAKKTSEEIADELSNVQNW